MPYIYLALALAFATPTFAENNTTPPNIIIDEGAELEPEVQITQGQNETREEFRINGRLYMIKVTPKIGAPYYLYDEEGKGEMRRLDHRAAQPVIPRWVLIEF